MARAEGSQLIAVEGLRFRYPGAPSEAVAGVSLELRESSLTAIIGPNGSGKSTLLKLLAGILRPLGGSVLLQGRAIESYSRVELARHIAYVPQHSLVGLPFTVSEVALMGRYPYQRGLGFESGSDLEAAERALALTETRELAHRPFASLSGGERQRVLIARAIAQDAQLLLLDEPTAALDLKHEVRAWEILERLVLEEAKTVVSVTHHLNLASLFSPRLILLKQGSLVASGAPGELLSEPLLESVYETPVRVETSPEREVFVLPRRVRR
jgi:iron complex transport system ATP-binding protein